MFIRSIDILSPHITLYFQGVNIHTSLFSGILTLISYGILLAAVVYFSQDFFNKNNPTAYFFNRYVKDVDTFPVNSSSMFNYIQIMDPKTRMPKPFEFDKIQIIGINITLESYMTLARLNSNFTYSHWLYGKCNNDTDTKGIGYLIEEDSFKEAACIKKFYNVETDQYYEVNDENFVWPTLEHGASHPNVTFYGIIIKKCDNKGIIVKNLECADEKEINEYISNYIFLNFKIIDHYADVLNYKSPLTKYFYSVTSGISKSSFTLNNLNFSPSLIKSNTGIILDKKEEEKGYFFSQNAKRTYEDNDSILCSFFLLMQNTHQYYERHYKRLQDILSNVGGIGSLVFILARIINLLVSSFIILLDTEHLLFSNFNIDLKNLNEIRYFSESQKRQKSSFLQKKHSNENNNDGNPNYHYKVSSHVNKHIKEDNKNYSLINNKSKISEEVSLRKNSDMINECWKS